MVNEKLMSFILKARQNKRNDEQILQQLLSVGWKQEAIDEAFSEIKSRKLVAPTAAQAAKTAKDAAAAAQQPQPAAPPWVKPDQAAPSQAAPTQPATSSSVSSQPISPQAAPILPPSSAQPQPSQPAPAASPLPAPASSQPAMPPLQPEQPHFVPPASQINLQPPKKSFFSSLFGKKQAASQAPMASQQQSAQVQQSSLPATPPAIGKQPAIASTQSILHSPIIPPQPVAQGQSTLATFAGESTAPASGPQAPSQQPLSSAPAQPIQPPAGTASPPSQPVQKPPIVLQPKPSGGIMKLLPFIAFAILLAAAGAYYVFVIMPAGSAAPIAPPAQNTTLPVQNATPANPAQKASAPIDCGADMDCLIAASGSCRIANATHSSTTDTSGMVVSGTAYMEIKSAPEQGKCILYMKTTNSSVKFSDSLVAASLASGISIDEIKKQEAEAVKQAKASIGLNGTCKFSTSALPSLLAKWKAGAFSQSDTAGAACSGTLFDSLAQPNLTGAANASQAANTTIKANATASNATKANSSGTAIKTNATSGAAKNTTTGTAAKNTTAAKPAATPGTNSSSSTNASGNQSIPSFPFSRKYTTYYPEHLVWFCGDRNTTFYRMHWREYYGGGCGVEKPKEGYLDLAGYQATLCTQLPCCINGPYSEYSRSYDYFECGYN